MRFVGLSAFVLAGFVALTGAPSASAATTKVCARHLDPSGATLLAKGVSCKAAFKVAYRVNTATHPAPFNFRIDGRSWRCGTQVGDRLDCKAGSARVTLRIQG